MGRTIKLHEPLSNQEIRQEIERIVSEKGPDLSADALDRVSEAIIDKYEHGLDLARDCGAGVEVDGSVMLHSETGTVYIEDFNPIMYKLSLIAPHRDLVDALVSRFFEGD